jgi:ribose transport system ATP-binding protein
MQQALLEIRGLSKAFAAPVLSGIDLDLFPGEVLALTGENGAGKSTLSRIIAGLLPADGGSLKLNGDAFTPPSRGDAERAGVRMVLQELSVIDTLTVAENLFMGDLPARFGFVNRQALASRASQLLRKVGLESLDPAQRVGDLGIGQQQLIEIARGLDGAARILILDEPTAMLSAHEVATLFQQIAALREQGVSIIYISHRLDEVQRLADRIVVLRDGRLVENRRASELTHDAIVRAMVGRELASHEDRTRRVAGAERLRCVSLSRRPAVRNVSLTLHAGEIVGLAGLVGSGRTELLRLLFGADRPDNGDIFLSGQSEPASITSPSAAVELGIGLLTEDRKSQGLLLGQSVRTNLTLAAIRNVSRRGWISEAREASTTDRWSERLRIHARDREQHVDELSGGNQQKVLLGRWLHRNCDVLLLDEPTRGVDIGARADIYDELGLLARDGKALLVVSSDLRELMSLCDRIGVLSAGDLVQTFERGEWTEEALLAAAFSAYATSEPRVRAS